MFASPTVKGDTDLSATAPGTGTAAPASAAADAALLLVGRETKARPALASISRTGGTPSSSGVGEEHEAGLEVAWGLR
ncbi:hypothetical protein NG895_14590 [Aeoliella sp. ICT_H6.2]|uniref:Uncharacterized protein n=1 Tax=Aeoliella straminimaris TaxID=2954799 RepID=A0A9X2FHN8_9BACT|nr:hypothetical protein [Aeoliella straminimaris]MCO6045136.1 hypothetical protein [Aeoliella straminimaris]